MRNSRLCCCATPVTIMRICLGSMPWRICLVRYRRLWLPEWSRWFFSRLLIPQLSLLVMEGRLLPLASPALRVGADGVVDGFWLSHGGSTLASIWPHAASEREALRASLLWLLEQALLPWIQRLERVVGCRARILWGNAPLLELVAGV